MYSDTFMSYLGLNYKWGPSLFGFSLNSDILIAVTLNTIFDQGLADSFPDKLNW